MSDERNDDEILGRALSRAIETQDTRETPFEQSRLAVHPLRRGIAVWQLVGTTAAALVVVLAFGTWLMRPSEAPQGAASQAPTPGVTATPALASATTLPTTQLWVYFTRDALPPVGANISAPMSGTTPKDRIDARLTALHSVVSPNMPQGANDPFASVGRVGNSFSYGVGVRIDGDLATLTFQLPNGWGIHGTAQSQQLVQQIVYTVTEEVGVRRVLIVEDGKTTATIDQLVITKALTRDDVSGYTTRADAGLTWRGNDAAGRAVGATLVKREIQDGTAVRFTFEGRDRAANDAVADLPTITVAFGANSGALPHNVSDGAPPADVLSVSFKWNATYSSGGVGHVERIDRSPLRLIAGDFNTSYQIGLDDGRPWRAWMPDAQHLVVEVGGDPQTLSDTIAIWSPATGWPPRPHFSVSGVARTYEGNLQWRLRDSTQRVVAAGFTKASMGLSAEWGTFQFEVDIPTNAAGGDFRLEVYWPSPKDGSEQGLVVVHLKVG